MRTVWLALFCLMALAVTVVAKIGMSPYASADVRQGVASANSKVSSDRSSPDAVAFSLKDATAATTKGDKLEVSYTYEVALEDKSVKSVAIALPATEPKEVSKKMDRIVSRHWHDPFDKRMVAIQAPVKRKNVHHER
jgi:hypothetical protein